MVLSGLFRVAVLNIGFGEFLGVKDVSQVVHCIQPLMELHQWPNVATNYSGLFPAFPNRCFFKCFSFAYSAARNLPRQTVQQEAVLAYQQDIITFRYDHSDALAMLADIVIFGEVAEVDFYPADVVKIVLVNNLVGTNHRAQTLVREHRLAVTQLKKVL